MSHIIYQLQRTSIQTIVSKKRKNFDPTWQHQQIESPEFRSSLLSLKCKFTKTAFHDFHLIDYQQKNTIKINLKKCKQGKVECPPAQKSQDQFLLSNLVSSEATKPQKQTQLLDQNKINL